MHITRSLSGPSRSVEMFSPEIGGVSEEAEPLLEVSVGLLSEVCSHGDTVEGRGNGAVGRAV